MFATLLCNCFGSGRAKLHLQPPLSVLIMLALFRVLLTVFRYICERGMHLTNSIRCPHIVLFVMVNVSLVIVCRRCA